MLRVLLFTPPVNTFK